MIERTNCRGVGRRGKTNSVAPPSQTMNQRARHAFHSRDHPTTRDHRTWVRERETNGATEDRRIERRTRGKKEKADWGRVKGRDTTARGRDCGVRFGLYYCQRRRRRSVKSVSFECQRSAGQDRAKSKLRKRKEGGAREIRDKSKSDRFSSTESLYIARD